MKPSSLWSRCRAAAAAALLTVGAGALHAGEVRAVAGENTFAATQDANAGTLATAVSTDQVPGGGSSATATRFKVSAISDGAGAGPTAMFFHFASGSATTQYTLWDSATNAPIPFEEAVAMRLNFNFRALGLLKMQPGAVGLDVGTVNYGAQVLSFGSVHVSERYNGLSYVVNNPPGDGYTGDISLLGLSKQEFTLEHTGSTNGQFWLSYGNSGANDAKANGSMSLLTVTVAAPASAAVRNNLGLMLDTGEFIAFGQRLQRNR